MLSAIWRKKKSSFRDSDDEKRQIVFERYFEDRNLNTVINTKPILCPKEEAGFPGQDHRCSNCFLRFCHLCHKPLSLDKEVYMYRGEVGFCSLECRRRQMYLDEMKKIEISARRILASFHQRRRNGRARCEPRDLRGTEAPPIFMLN